MSVPGHHKRQELCSSRAPYREGRKPKAVKVYTVNQESKYLLVQGVPSVGATQELIKLFAIHGAITEYRILDDYPADHFTEVYLVKFEKIQAARAAKRRLDDWSFYGGVLHVCYAPEYETVQETREKLQDRRKTIAAKVRQYEHDGTYSSPYTSSSQNASVNQHQQSGSLFQREDNKWSGSSMVTETSQSKPVQEQDQQASQQIQSAPVSHINRSDMSRTNFYGTKAYQYPPETQNVSGFVQNKIMPNRVQSRDVRNNPPTSSGATCSSTDPWKHPGQTYDYQTMAGSDERQEVQLKLPLPPKQMHHGMSRHNQRLQNYTFAHVPTAQAEFPVDYDARLGAPSERNLSDSDEALADKSEQFSENLDSSNLLSQKAHESIGDKMKNSAKSEKSKSMQEKIEENLKNKTDIVIKKLDSSRPVPKFIPRQAQIKKTPSVTGHTNTDKVKHTENDPVNRELKRNAFTLGKPQGPINPGSELVQETEEVEESVNKTVKDIRKRMIQLSDNKELLTKKKKTV